MQDYKPIFTKLPPWSIWFENATEPSLASNGYCLTDQRRLRWSVKQYPFHPDDALTRKIVPSEGILSVFMGHNGNKNSTKWL